MGDEIGGADALVAAAGRVGAPDAGQDGDAKLLQLRMTEEGGAVSAPVGIDFLLLGKLNAGAVHQPDQGDVQALGQIGDPKLVLGLAGNPGAGHDLVVKTGHHAPFAA